MAGSASGRVGSGQGLAIEGTVIDTKHNPIVGAEVSLLEIPGTALTSSTGEYRLSVPSSGHFSLRVRRIGYVARILEVSVSDPLTRLKPLILEDSPVRISDLTTEGRIPRPKFNLRFSAYVSGMLYHDVYRTWDTHGASLSPNGFAIVTYLSSASAPVFYSWYQSMNPRLVSGSVGPVGCPGPEDVPLSTAWIGWTDTVRMILRNGTTWKRRQNSLQRGPCLGGSIQGVDTVLSAGPMLGGWLFAASRPDSGFQLLYQSAIGHIVWETSLPAFLSERSKLEKSFITETSTGATLSEASWPFRWVKMGPGGKGALASSPTSLPELGDSLRYSGWTALAVLDIGGGFVQSLISPQARERLIVVYDLLGKPLYATGAAGAPALLAVDSERRRLIGIRYSSAGKGRGEIIEYEY